ncbi:DNA cytosine methyltransferase [Roseobacter sp. S98]|uniref:DNA cytosine methyltransferase n=1 Tax=Roseobacter algicola (ex Choi et al. 2025) (nom. illeg.) TaxID=3092138 RepID=UPI003F5155F2
MGLELAEPGFATACYVEIEPEARKRLIAAQRNGYMHSAPIWDDLKTFDARPWRGICDTILAGYPCQPFSHAGQRKGKDDPRHLWPDIKRIVRELEPTWCFFENVAGHLSLGLEDVVRDLRGMGFGVAAGLFSAEETGASHERQRVFILAHSEGNQRWRKQQTARAGRGRAGSSGSGSKLADANGRNSSAEWQFGRGQQRLHAQSGSSVDDAGYPPGRSDTPVRNVSNGTGPGWPQENGGAREPGESLGDTERLRWREGQPKHEIYRWRDATSCASGELAGPEIFDTLLSQRPLAPPGPSEVEEWSRALESSGHLAPAISLREIYTWARRSEAAGFEWESAPQSAVRGMVDGMATRSHALRLLGNGVHPLAAGYAFRTLAPALGLGRLDLGNP